MDYDIIIYGTGHAGITLKAMLSSIRGLRVLLLDPVNHYHNIKSDLPRRLFAISDGSLQILRQFTGEEFWSNMGQPIMNIKVMDGASQLNFSPQDINADNFGLMIQEMDLYNALNKLGNSISLKKESICEIQQDEYKVTLTLGDHSKISSSLLIATDGKYSSIRKKIGAAVFKHDYKQYGLVCEVDHAMHHNGMAVEKFISSGPFAILPRLGGYSSAVVWSVKKEWRQAFESLPLDLQHELIIKHFPNSYGNAKVSSAIQLFPLNLQVLKQQVHGRIVFVGDAAHAIHPLAGQGFNLTIRDINILTQKIAENFNLGLDLGCSLMLQNYCRERQLDIDVMVEATHYLNALFSNNSKVISFIRRLGLNVMDKSLFLKKYCMKYALGHIS